MPRSLALCVLLRDIASDVSVLRRSMSARKFDGGIGRVVTEAIAASPFQPAREAVVVAGPEICGACQAHQPADAPPHIDGDAV